MDNFLEPTKEIINKYIQLFNEKEKNKEQVLCYLFNKSDTIEDIMAQVFLLNALYSTHVDNSSLALIANRIYSDDLIDEIKDKSRMTIEDKCETVNKIANLGNNNVISFASKYCSWICCAKDSENKKTYPIFDRYSRGMIWKINTTFCGEESTKTSYYYYNIFAEAFEKAYDRYSSDYSYKDFDKYLWMFGKENGIYIE